MHFLWASQTPHRDDGNKVILTRFVCHDINTWVEEPTGVYVVALKKVKL
jgi:hypothetical protein